mgnify:CR=1 FL=1
MSGLNNIRDAAAQAGLRFLLIGGNAIIAYGVQRETADLDLLVCRDDLSRWRDLFLGRGYTVFHDGGNFIQFAPPSEGAWPTDLMIVNNETFTKLEAGSRSFSLWNQEWRIPSPAHMVALKLHALVHGPKHRHLRDFLDVVEIIKAQRLDPDGPELCDIFAKHGTPRLHRSVLLACEADGL